MPLTVTRLKSGSQLELCTIMVNNKNVDVAPDLRLVFNVIPERARV